MKRALLFLLFGGAGIWGLLQMSGGIDGPATGRPDPVAETPASNAGESEMADIAPDAPTINTGGLGAGPPVSTKGGENIDVRARTSTLSWTDPATGDVHEIRGWFAWRFRAASFEGLAQGDAGTQGILCRDVVLELFREPLTFSETQQRIAGKLEPVIRQRITAKTARAFGSIAQKINDKTGKRVSEPGPDSKVELMGDVVIIDRGQGLRITGEHLRAYPVQERASGDGAFKVEHEAITLSGRRMTMERHERGWTRVEIGTSPPSGRAGAEPRTPTLLRVHSDVRDKDGKPLFNFGSGEFRPTSVLSNGRAILVREQGRREERMRITFPDGVRAQQMGGRELIAQRLEILATQATPVAGVRNKRWALRNLNAEDGVKIEYPNKDKQGKSFLTSISAQRLTHVIPTVGRPRTELYGEPRIVLRGQLPINGKGSPDDQLHIWCRDRAWIEPVTTAEVDPSLDASRMQRLSLRGDVRIERHPGTPGEGQDTLEAESIDLLMLEQKRPDGKSGTVAVQFSAREDVRLGGTRIRGFTPRLIAEGLHTEQPHVYAIGRGTNFIISLLRQDQGLLGPDRSIPITPSTQPTSPAQPASPGSRTLRADDNAPTPSRFRWTVRKVLARGNVQSETQLGGASVGLPTRIHALEASYDSEQGLARLNGKSGAPVRVLSTLSPNETNSVVAQTIVLDRSNGVISARHGVRAELYVSEDGGFGATAAERAPAKPLEMSIQTDDRIDLHLVRNASGTSPRPDQRQRLSVRGPLIAELKSESLTVDRLRANSLEVELAAEPQGAAESSAANTPTSPTARAPRAQPNNSTASNPGSGNTDSGSPRPTNIPAKPRTRVDVTARDVRIQMLEGEVQTLDASGGVTLRGRPGNVAGDRLTYNATTRRVEITAGSDPVRRPATALLGTTDSRTEISGARLGVLWTDAGIQAADATAPAGHKSRIRLFRRDPRKPGTLERFELRYEQTVRLLPDRLDARNVVVIRTVRDLRAQTNSEPSALYADRLQVFGANLLSRQAVEITRMVAEGKTTYFRSKQSGRTLQAWGSRFDYNVSTGMANLSERSGRDVAMRLGERELDMDFPNVQIDVAQGLPYFPNGTDLVLRNGKK